MKIYKKVLLSIFSIILFIATVPLIVYFIITAGTNLDNSKLINYQPQIIIYDKNCKQISTTSLEGKRESTKLNDLNSYTINAFIANEDHKFYQHKGINYYRIIAAVIKNIQSKSFKQGASTITQQLIKNTHLSNEKTLIRKLKEIKLAKQLEKQYSKDQILEMYLNTIYFGHHCYGIESASKYYFSKSAKDLSLSESATLVGLLSSPNNYSPVNNPAKSKEKRNSVLKNMLKNQMIDQTTYETQADEALITNVSQQSSTLLYSIIEELDQLNIAPKNETIRIYTQINNNLQDNLNQIAHDTDYSIIIANNKTNKIENISSNISITTKRQPGSTIKPLLVYGPAIDINHIETFTKIKDEPINYNGYKPQNADHLYHGMVTVKESILNSYNIPAVKLLNQIGIEKAFEYGNKLEIQLDKNDKNLSLALGGFTNGITLIDLVNGYMSFANQGYWNKNTIIEKIENEKKQTIYECKHYNKQIYETGTASLMNGMLLQTKTNGTAKLLKNIPYDLAIKTGTVGNENGNTDTYALAYTKLHTIGIWLGSKANKQTNITSSKNCCELLNIILTNLYTHYPEKINTTIGTKEIIIDRNLYENENKIQIAENITPIMQKMCVIVKESSNYYTLSNNYTKPTIKIKEIIDKNNKIIILLCYAYYYDYLVKTDISSYTVSKLNDKNTNIIEINKTDHTSSYYLIPYYSYNNKTYYGEAINLGKFNKNESNSSNSQPNIDKDFLDHWFYD